MLNCNPLNVNIIDTSCSTEFQHLRDVSIQHFMGPLITLTLCYFTAVEFMCVVVGTSIVVNAMTMKV